MQTGIKNGGDLRERTARVYSMRYADIEAGEEGRKQIAVLDVLDAEWDLLVEIQDTLRELPGVDLT